jgi:hypothetical protein
MEPEMGDARRKTITHGTHHHGHLSGSGQRRETTEVMVFDPGWNLGVHRPDSLQKRRSYLRPKDRVVTMDDDQSLGEDTRLPGGFG